MDKLGSAAPATRQLEVNEAMNILGAKIREAQDLSVTVRDSFKPVLREPEPDEKTRPPAGPASMTAPLAVELLEHTDMVQAVCDVLMDVIKRREV